MPPWAFSDVSCAASAIDPRTCSYVCLVGNIQNAYVDTTKRGSLATNRARAGPQSHRTASTVYAPRTEGPSSRASLETPRKAYSAW